MTPNDTHYSLTVEVLDPSRGPIPGEIVMLSRERVSMRFSVPRAPILPLAREVSLRVSEIGGEPVETQAVVTRRLEFDDSRQYELEFSDPAVIWSEVGLDVLLAANLKPHSRAQPAAAEGVPVRVEFGTDGESIEGELSDISAEGLAVTLPARLDAELENRLAGMRGLRVVFTLPGDAETNSCDVQIRRRSLLEAGQRYGLIFGAERDPGMEARIQRFIARRRREVVGVRPVREAESTIQSRISKAMWLVAVGFIALAVATLLILGDRFAAKDIASRLHSAELRLEQELQAQEAELRQVAHLIAGGEGLGAEFIEPERDYRQLLRTTFESQKWFQDVDMVVLVDCDGQVVTNTAYPGTSRQPWTPDHRVWRAHDACLLVSSSPIKVAGKIVGYVVAGRRIDTQFATRVHERTDSDVLVVGRDRMIAGAWDEVARQPVQTEEVEQLWELGSSDDYHRVRLCGAAAFVSLIPLGEGVSFVVSVSASDIMAIYWLLVLWLGGAAVIVTALSFWLSRFIAGKLSRPIDELTQVSIELAEGNLDTSVSQSGPRELVVLAGTFNRMAERIQHLMADARRQARMLEEQRSRLELANAKDDFLVTVSHELLTPLTNILSSSEILSMMIGGQGSEQEEFLSIIEDQSEVLRKLITQFLDLANLRNGRGEWKEGEMDLAQVVRSATEMARDRHSVAPALEPVLPDEPCLYLGDEERMCQAFCHVVDNAIKFAPEGTVPEVRLSRVDDGFRFTVTDLGRGVPEDDREHIFEQFYQSGDVLTDRPDGTGIGLSICKEILDHHQATIACSDNAPQGARFDVNLPGRC